MGISLPSVVIRGSPDRPNIVGMEGPKMSTSRSPTLRPLLASDSAVLTETVDLPTPPFAELTTTVFLTPAIGSGRLVVFLGILGAEAGDFGIPKGFSCDLRAGEVWKFAEIGCRRLTAAIERWIGAIRRKPRISETVLCGALKCGVERERQDWEVEIFMHNRTLKG